jgi:hypothetical protein
VTETPRTRGTTQADVARRRVNVAVTAWSALIVTLHVDVPEQSPDQPPNDEPPAAFAFSVTAVPVANVAEHVVPQSMPAGVDVTVPEPLPLFVTVSLGAEAAKLADTAWSAVIVTVHVPVPEQSPDQLENDEPEVGVAVNVTVDPPANDAEHVPGQLIPAGEEVTVPPPAPPTATDNVCGCAANVAVTE